jgi:hypothetical protein
VNQDPEFPPWSDAGYTQGAKWTWRGGKYITLLGTDVPAEYWADHKGAWVLATNYGDGIFKPGDEPSRAWDSGGLKKISGDYVKSTRLVMIPYHFYVEPANELGEIHP